MQGSHLYIGGAAPSWPFGPWTARSAWTERRVREEAGSLRGGGARAAEHERPRSRPSPLQTQEPGSGRAEPPPPGVKIEPRHGERLPSPHLFHARYLACGISFVRDTHARIP
uniref:Uncharacterized protein n=1 Tax=Rousettus aegyptiacus TaxID=9407 RepID=A0A7J8FFJ1_ROUAE|nr:hypothetical protein HJG63_002094 [Rousettus aegyptiacus]